MQSPCLDLLVQPCTSWISSWRKAATWPSEIGQVGALFFFFFLLPQTHWGLCKKTGWTALSRFYLSPEMKATLSHTISVHLSQLLCYWHRQSMMLPSSKNWTVLCSVSLLLCLVFTRYQCNISLGSIFFFSFHLCSFFSHLAAFLLSLLSLFPCRVLLNHTSRPHSSLLFPCVKWDGITRNDAAHFLCI